MLRGLMYVLLAWPTLMPPGICVCQLQAAIVIAPQTSENAGEPVACCGKCGRSQCNHQKSASTDNTRTDGENLPPQTPEHAPGCPANPSYSVRMAPTFEVRTSLSDFEFSHVLLDSLTPALVSMVATSTLAVDVSPPPSPSDIFLLFCNIRC